MARCIELAKGGRGYTSPNPMVGAVVVREGRIIGEGFHRKCGEAHAEVNAIASVRDEALLRDATLYVSLEPCSHYGKTPPCAELIIRKGIPRVVVGCLDPFPAVAGRGVRMLREAGVEVVTGVVLSTAATSREVHRLRSEVAAIMVGTRTALLDNPSLNVRHWYGRSPVRVVLDRRLEIPASYHLLDGSTPTLVFTEREAPECDGVEYIRIDFGSSVPGQVLRELAARKIDSLLVEGGARLLRSFLDEGLWDEARVETSPVLLGEGVEAPVLDRRAVSLLEGPSIRCFRHPEWTL